MFTQHYIKLLYKSNVVQLFNSNLIMILLRYLYYFIYLKAGINQYFVNISTRKNTILLIVNIYMSIKMEGF